MAIDLELCAIGLLEWLYDNSGEGWHEIPGIDTYLVEHKVPGGTGFVVVDHLADHGLVKNLNTMGSADAAITPSGIAHVQSLRTKRQKDRVPTLRTRMLLWLDDQEQRGNPPTDWTAFLASSHADYHGNPFTEAELAREADYLMSQELIAAFGAWNSHAGWIRPRLTLAGRDCVVDHGGNVSDYRDRGRNSGNTTNIKMADVSGNIVVASHNVVQSVTTGLDTRALLKFAGYVHQVLPTLGLSEEQQYELAEQTEQLHEAADSPTPEPSKLRRLVAAILDGIRRAGPTVAQQMAIAMGEEAVKAITGG